MYSLGAILLPDDILKIAQIHNAGFFPMDAKMKGYRFDDQFFFLEFDTQDDVGSRPISMEFKGDSLREGGSLAPKTDGVYATVKIDWPEVFKLIRYHVKGVPRDAKPVFPVQVKNIPGGYLHFFRLRFETDSSDELVFDEEGKPKDFRVTPTVTDGVYTGELRYLGARPN